MSKAIGNIFALGLAPEPNDEEKERLEQLSRQALPYLQSAKPLEGEDFRNSADKYLRILENAKGDNNQSNYNFAKPTTAFTENNVQYAQLADTNIATDATNQNNNVDYSLYGDDFSKEEIDQMLQDQEFQTILNDYIIPNEGGYVNDFDDSGGETNMGIAQNAHPNEDIKNLTRERANAIYYRDYYNWNGLNKLPYPIRGFVVDYGLPTSPQNALKTVHNVLEIPKEATIIGPTTLGKFENFSDEDYDDFLEKYREEMKKRFNEIARRNPQKQKFLNGWINRANRAHLAK